MKVQESNKIVLDWEVVCVDSATYAIYHKDYNQEWQDENGDNLTFDTQDEAVSYLNQYFKFKA